MQIIWPPDYIVQDTVFHVGTIILILYLIYRDRQELRIINKGYDKLVGDVLDNITKQQTKYKDDLSSDIKELSSNTGKVFLAVEQVVKGVNAVEQGVSQINIGVNEVVKSVEKVVEAVESVKACDLELSNTLKNYAEHLKRTTSTFYVACTSFDRISSVLERLDQHIKEEQNQSQDKIQLRKKEIEKNNNTTDNNTCTNK